MSKFVVTEYGNKLEILKFPDHYVAIPVTVDATGVSLVNGKKIVPAGTIVGGTDASILDDPEELAVKGYTAGTKASVATGTGQDYKITWTARRVGAAGNSISITITGSADASLGVAVSGKDITITLEKDSSIKSTVDEVIAAVAAHPVAGKLVVGVGEAGKGDTIMAAASKASLANGADSVPAIIDGVLLNDVDVTYGDAPGAMLIHGFVDATKLPSDLVLDDIIKDTLPLIKFIA